MDRRHLLSDQDDRIHHYPAACTTGQWTTASAPLAAQINTMPGYNHYGPGNNVLPPPPIGFTLPQPPATAPAQQWNIPAISEELAREAFLEYAASECCYSKKPPKEMVITALQAHNTYRYRLETFTESRSTEWASVPYNGQTVVGGVAPGPWDIAVSVPAMFQNSKKDIRIPHTASVKGCHSCLNLGKSACAKCVATGRVQCRKCGGSGMEKEGRCSLCEGQGRTKCRDCSGVGSTKCKTCQGKGKLLCYIKLNINWTNNNYVQVMDKQSGFPTELYNSVSGKTLFTDMNALVYPVSNFPDEAVNVVSKKAVQEHQAKFSTTCRMLQQRQTIELIPVTRVHYTWKEKTNVFFVYGVEHRVYAKDYPATCCTIL